MSRLNSHSVLRPDTLAALDASFHAGEFDTLTPLDVPQFDPESDPFGMDYSWLEAPHGAEAQSVLSTIQSRTESEWRTEAGRVVREFALGGSLAGGTGEQVFQKWIDEGFVALCFAAGSKGEAALAHARSSEEPIETRIEALAEWFKTQPKFQTLKDEDRFAVAVAAIEHFAASSP